MRFEQLRSIFLVFVLLLLPGTILGQAIQSPSTDLYEYGIRLYDEGQFEEAESSLQEFKFGNEEHELLISTDYFIARSKAGSDSVNIESYYQEFILNHPGSDLSVILLKDLGHRYTDNREYDLAIEYYNQAIDSWMGKTRAAETMYWVAEAAAEKMDYQQSRFYFLKLADDYPESEWAPEALYARGRLYLTENEYDSSAVAFELLKIGRAHV